ncbi:MAG: hypothetical protein E7602_05895 [Ruminococcaceae bacterium]|nr:hypothetical protein [Oscillospiraceae bacterium]
MRYVLSDIHGEYDLFCALLKRIEFSENDTIYICGDIIDKGEKSIQLARYISSFENMHCIIGNHELAFLNYYNSLLRSSPDDFDEVLKKLQKYFCEDGKFLDWKLVDWLEGLPSYIEEEDFICVHAGVPMDDSKKLFPLASVDIEYLVYDRKFKNPDVMHGSSKCVFFGHTETNCICGENRILAYCRRKDMEPKEVKDFYKIHLDTGAWRSGVLGCFCIDTLSTIYVSKEEIF